MTPQQIWHKYYLRRKERRRQARLFRTATCQECGTVFSQAHKLLKTCSAVCRSIRKRRQVEARPKKKRLYVKPVLTPEQHEALRAKQRLWFAAKMARKNSELSIVCKNCQQRKQVSNGRFEHCSLGCRADYERKQSIIRSQRPEAKAKRNAFIRAKLKRDPQFRLRAIVSKTVWRALRKNHAHKSSSVLKALPYTIVQLKAHLESQFDNRNKFTWENYGSLWDIDHIIPQKYFPYTSMDSKMFRDCWALSNLQPLEKKTNQRKHARLNYIYAN